MAAPISKKPGSRKLDPGFLYGKIDYSCTKPLKQMMVVADDQHPQIAFLCFCNQKIPNLRLSDLIQHSGDLIAQQKSQTGLKNPRNAETL